MSRPTKYADHLRDRRRLALLLNLYFQPGYVARTPDLQTLVQHRNALVASLDTLRADLAWLAETGLVDEDVDDAWRLTERGADVALGRGQTPGVARPGPGEV